MTDWLHLPDWQGLYWEQPHWLWLLALLPAWLGLHWRRPLNLMRSRAVLLHPLAAELPGGQPSPSAQRLSLLLRTLGLAGLILALAQPREVVRWIEPPAIGRDIALVVDVSDSMSRADFTLDGQPATRMQMVRKLLTDFVQQRPADRFTLMVYGHGAAMLMPPTFDRLHTLHQIQRLRTGLLGDGTALGDALALAVRQIRHRELAPSVMVFGDGDPSNAGQVTPAEALAAAQGAQVQIHALQIGTSAPADTDQPRLPDMARLTGGQFTAVQSTDQAVRFMQRINQAAPILRPPPEHRIVREWLHLPLALALALFGLAMLADFATQRGRRAS